MSYYSRLLQSDIDPPSLNSVDLTELRDLFSKNLTFWTSYSRNKCVTRRFIMTSSLVRDQKMRHFEAVEVEIWFFEV